MLWFAVAVAALSIGTVAGFVLGKRASTWCPGCGETVGAFAPRPFALRDFDGADTSGRLLAWGMTLPDGSVVTVDWRRGPSSGVTISATPEQAARLHGADLEWLPRPA